MSTRVLIIDPNIPFMSSLQKALEGTHAFEVSLSANAVAAQESLRSGEFDIAVIDLSIADMDIAELIGRFRQLNPELRLLVSHSTDEQAHTAARLRVDGTIAKPYLARDLIVRLGEVQSRRAPGKTEPDDDTLRRQAQTRILRDTPDPGGTDTLGDWQDIDRTGSLRKTDMLPEPRSPVDAWIDSEATPPFFEEPPARSGDTPTVFSPDLDRLVQFPADETPAHDDSSFDEVLDALSQTPLPESPSSPDDRAFHELVDSLRTPDAPSRRSTLEDLLNTPPNDAPSLDYVLDSIRRAQAAADPETLDESALDDTTIRDVIEGLAPEFQDVLALLDGEDVAEGNYPEPSYSGGHAEPSHGSDEADRLGPVDLAADDMPDWMRPDAPPEDARRALPPVEPPPTEEDSKHYPATAALNAVADEDAEFSLNDLLNQIEQQLPPPREQRPHLRPLPSWEENASPEEAERLREIFPPANEWEPADIEEIFPEPTAIGPVEAEPMDIDAELFPAPDEPLGAEWDAFADETPADEVLPANFEQLLAQADEAEQDEADRVALELDLDDDLIDAVQRAAGDDPYVEEPPTVDDDTLGTEITEAFYEGVRQTAYELDETPAPEHTAVAVDDGWDAEPGDQGARDYGGPRSYQLAEDDEPLPESPRAAYLPDSTAEQAMLPAIEYDQDEDSEDAARLAQIALELTQFSLESSAQATVLTHGDELIAQAGNLPRPALDQLQRAIDTAWSTSPPDYDSLSRFVTLPNLGEFMLFSMVVANEMLLSMIFNANTPVRTIRRQARRLSESLELVPEPPETPEPEPSPTHASRPTDLRAPEGLRPAPPPVEQQPAAEPRRPDTSYTGYTVLWLPWDPRVELSGSYAQALHGWIEDVAEQHAWEIDEMVVESDYVQLAVQLPQKSLPDVMLHTLFDETARLTEEHFPELIDGAGRLWANGYYVVTPPRALSEREIGRFVTYQRQAQIG